MRINRHAARTLARNAPTAWRNAPDLRSQILRHTQHIVCGGSAGRSGRRVDAVDVVVQPFRPRRRLMHVAGNFAALRPAAAPSPRRSPWRFDPDARPPAPIPPIAPTASWVDACIATICAEISFGRPGALGCEVLHLGGDDGEALASLACPCRLDRRVQRQQIGLAGYSADHADHVTDAIGGLDQVAAPSAGYDGSGRSPRVRSPRHAPPGWPLRRSRLKAPPPRRRRSARSPRRSPDAVAATWACSLVWRAELATACAARIHAFSPGRHVLHHAGNCPFEVVGDQQDRLALFRSA